MVVVKQFLRLILSLPENLRKSAMIELEALRALDPRAYGRSSDRLPTLGLIKHDHGTYSIAPKRCMHCFGSAVRGAGEWSEYPTYSPSPNKKAGSRPAFLCVSKLT